MPMNNQNNDNDFPDQRNIAQIYNRQNKMNQNIMMNNNMNMMNNSNQMNLMNNNMNVMNNNMNNNMNMTNNNINNNMNMMNNNMHNNMNMMNNNMNVINNNMHNNMNTMNINISNNMNMMNNNINNNMNMMNNNINHNMNMMNNNINNNINNNMMNNNMNNNMKNMRMNNMLLLKNNMGNMGMNNNNNNMGIVKYNAPSFQINWFNNSFLPNTMNQNNYYAMRMFQNQFLQRQYYQMLFQQKMFYQINIMLMEKKRMQRMKEILEQGGQRNEDDYSFVPLNINGNNNNSNDNIYDNYTDNQALSDVIQESHPPQPSQNNQNQNNPILPSELISEVIVDVMNLNPDLLSGLGNNLTGEWAQGENRGGRPYKPPNGWIGYGLNVLNKYDNGNNDWLACNGRQGEWCIAFHGACSGQSSDNVKKGIKSILETNLRPGGGQAYQSHDDANHPGQKVGKGVYCSPEPSVIDGYAGIMNINGHNYKAAFMLRVKPDRLRYSSSRPDYWVINGDFSELRPYRLLIKPC